jgi:hypothetical protein
MQSALFAPLPPKEIHTEMRLGGGKTEKLIPVYLSTYSETIIQLFLHKVTDAEERRLYRTCLVSIFLAGYNVFM